MKKFPRSYLQRFKHQEELAARSTMVEPRLQTLQ
uniref:Uncharacterized protein n=1 Tax=Arundo donax TaxID=35708 RepID=A0A0A8Y8S1_ARUDO